MDDSFPAICSIRIRATRENVTFEKNIFRIFTCIATEAPAVSFGECVRF